MKSKSVLFNSDSNSMITDTIDTYLADGYKVVGFATSEAKPIGRIRTDLDLMYSVLMVKEYNQHDEFVDNLRERFHNENIESS